MVGDSSAGQCNLTVGVCNKLGVWCLAENSVHSFLLDVHRVSLLLFFFFIFIRHVATASPKSFRRRLHDLSPWWTISETRLCYLDHSVITFPLPFDCTMLTHYAILPRISAALSVPFNCRSGLTDPFICWTALTLRYLLVRPDCLLYMSVRAKCLYMLVRPVSEVTKHDWSSLWGQGTVSTYQEAFIDWLLLKSSALIRGWLKTLHRMWIRQINKTWRFTSQGELECMLGL